MNETTGSVHPDLAAHQARMKRKIYTVKDCIHLAFAYSSSNCTMIEGDDGVIIVDTLQSMENAEIAAAEFRKITDKPIKAVIFTHFHADHVSGVKAFVSEDDVASGRVDILGQADLTDHMLRDVGMIAPILGRRAIYQFGMRLAIGEDGTVGNGLGPPQRPGTRTFIQPTHTFDKFLEVTYSGIRIQIHHVPSETEDQSVVWLPDEKVLISADVIQGETFPNIYALRGTRFRDPMIWVAGVDRLREFGAETLLPHHGRPVEGAVAVDDVLVAYRDAVQYLHDQTIRWMNKGMTPDEIAEKVVMPDHLKDHPWLGEYYGSFKHCIPAIYAGYLGWYKGDPIKLDPLPFKERARRYVEIMGGRDRILEAAADALDNGEDQWAAELVTWLVRADTDDHQARALKAQALRQWGYRQKTSIWRNWGLTAALELEGKLEISAAGMVLGSPEQVGNFPLAGVLRILTVRLKAEEAMDTHAVIAFEATDTGEACALEIRRGVCQFYETPPGRVDATLSFERQFVTDWVFARITFEDARASGRVAVAGDASGIPGFLDKFEPFNEVSEIAIAVT